MEYERMAEEDKTDSKSVPISRLKWLFLFCVCSVLVVVVIVLIVELTKTSAGQASAGDRLKNLESDFYNWRLQQSPEFATETGVHSYDSDVKDYSLTALDTTKRKVDKYLQNLADIPRSELTRDQTYSYDVLHDTLLMFSSNYKWRFYGPLNPLNFLEGDEIDPAYSVKILNFNSKKDYEIYLKRMTGWIKKFGQYIDRFKAAVIHNHTNHRVSVEKVPGQIRKILVTHPEDSSYYDPFKTKLDKLSMSESHKNRLRSNGRQTINDLQTAYRAVADYIENEYLQHTRKTYGLWGLENGKENYKACLKWHISVDLTPEQVHQKGLDEVKRIMGEIRTIMKKRQFNGTVAQFYENLKSQPQFHMDSAEKLLEAYRFMVYDRAYPKLPNAFKNIPHLNVTVEAMPNDGPGGQYIQGTADGSREGVFQVNLKRPNETNTFSMMALTLHETVPGHHLQAIYALKSDLPGFQRNVETEEYFAVPYHFPFYTAYSEGWGLYAESLGEYLNIYKDDNELLGRYGEEIFRACRLVVDTGLHYLEWSRDKAIQYFLDHTPSARSEVEIEIDRYITWPGQACAYKIGELKIRELRETAKRTLGDKFDIKDFHSQILTHGPVPLGILETIIQDWMNEVTGNTTTTGGGSTGSRNTNLVMPLIPNLVG